MFPSFRFTLATIGGSGPLRGGHDQRTADLLPSMTLKTQPTRDRTVTKDAAAYDELVHQLVDAGAVDSRDSKVAKCRQQRRPERTLVAANSRGLVRLPRASPDHPGMGCVKPLLCGLSQQGARWGAHLATTQSDLSFLAPAACLGEGRNIFRTGFLLRAAQACAWYLGLQEHAPAICTPHFREWRRVIPFAICAEGFATPSPSSRRALCWFAHTLSLFTARLLQPTHVSGTNPRPDSFLATTARGFARSETNEPVPQGTRLLERRVRAQDASLLILKLFVGETRTPGLTQLLERRQSSVWRIVGLRRFLGSRLLCGCGPDSIDELPGVEAEIGRRDTRNGPSHRPRRRGKAGDDHGPFLWRCQMPTQTDRVPEQSLDRQRSLREVPAASN